MPVIRSNYKAPFWLRNGHAATIIPSLWRRVEGVHYERERISTPDDDFLDLDWNKQGSDSLVIISHGLEGNSQRPYVLGTAAYFLTKGWDILAWNCRSCGGEVNRQARFYHHGETGDLTLVVDHGHKVGYHNIFLIGFSMGGSMTIKFLSELDSQNSAVKGGAAASVPVNLTDSVKKFESWDMAFYRNRFLKKLESKVKRKAEKYPEVIEYKDFTSIKYFPDFDNVYTAPLHGFSDAFDFYDKASAINYLRRVKRPLLLVNALNDPFLTPSCYPIDLARNSRDVFLETPKYGGHVGFTCAGRYYTYLEERAYAFIADII